MKEYKEIPLLTANDVELRVAQINEYESKVVVTLLVYKDARVDMKILDDCFGRMNWKRRHSRENANCIVSVWDYEKNEWVDKEDTGKESYTEAEKGLASDSFKRACFNWGIGRELYKAPRISFDLNKEEIKTDKKGKKTTYASFFVKEMQFDKETEKFIKFVVVDRFDKVRFDLNKKGNGYAKPAATQKATQTTSDEPKEATTKPKAVTQAETKPAVDTATAEEKATVKQPDVYVKSYNGRQCVWFINKWRYLESLNKAELAYVIGEEKLADAHFAAKSLLHMRETNGE